jgi:hypothetical protein
MYRFLLFMFLILFVGAVACEKVDQAFETVEKVKALKSDIEKTADQVKRDLNRKGGRDQEHGVEGSGRIALFKSVGKGTRW